LLQKGLRDLKKIKKNYTVFDSKISLIYDAVILLFGNKKRKAFGVNSCKKLE